MEPKQKWYMQDECEECGSSDIYLKHIKRSAYEIVCRECGHISRIDGPFSFEEYEDAWDCHVLDTYAEERLEEYATLGEGKSVEDYARNLIEENIFSIADYPAVIEYVRWRLDAQQGLYRGLEYVTIDIPISLYADIRHEAHMEKNSEVNVVEKAVKIYLALPNEERFSDMLSSCHVSKDKK